MSKGIETFAEVLQDPEYLYEGDLDAYFRVITEAPNLHNGYHDLRHMLHVTYVCYKGLEFYRDKRQPVDAGEARNLLIAALFHDYDHTGTIGPDFRNIERAILGLRKNILNEDKLALDAISGIIRATQFPHDKLDKDTPITHRLIRDADLSQGLSDAWIGSTLEGLASEQRRSVTEMLEESINFFRGLHFETEFGEEVYGSRVSLRINEAEYLLRVLKVDNSQPRPSNS